MSDGGNPLSRWTPLRPARGEKEWASLSLSSRPDVILGDPEGGPYRQHEGLARGLSQLISLFAPQHPLPEDTRVSLTPIWAPGLGRGRNGIEVGIQGEGKMWRGKGGSGQGIWKRSLGVEGEAWLWGGGEEEFLFCLQATFWRRGEGQEVGEDGEGDRDA